MVKKVSVVKCSSYTQKEADKAVKKALDLIDFKIKKTNLKTIKRPATKIMLNVGEPERAFEFSFLPNDGVGLAREEFIINNYIKIHPSALLNFEKIKDIKDKKLRAKLISTHENLKNIDRNIERNIKENPNKKSEAKIVKTKEAIEYFRANAIENQKTTQQTIRSMMNCIFYLDIMDNNQIERFRHFQSLFEVNLTNALELSEKLKQKVRAV